jgi:two-component sensor histidine kinase
MRYLETLEARVVAMFGLFLCILLVGILALTLVSSERHAAEQARLITDAVNGLLEENLLTLMQTTSGDRLNVFLTNAEQMTGPCQIRVIRSSRLAEQYGTEPVQLPIDAMERGVLQTGRMASDVTQIGGQRIFRQVVALPAREECLACHRVQSGDLLGAISVSIPMDEVYGGDIGYARKLFLISLSIVSAMALGLLLLLRRSVLIPLRVVSHYAETLAHGELNRRIEIKTTGEIGQLAQTLNVMAAKLQAREETIEENRHALDLSNKQLLALIQEMHHRIKNNLQSIASLLELEMLERCPSLEAQDCLQKSVNRVKSIAAVHQLLSEQSASFTNVKDLARSLAAITTRSLVDPAKKVTISVHGPEVYLTSHRATSLALILNELLSNAVKHGLAERRSGSISIDFTTDARGVTIAVKDDGVGLPPGFDMQASAHLGLQIARNLTESDLGGSLTLYGDHGTKAVIFFPE